MALPSNKPCQRAGGCGHTYIFTQSYYHPVPAYSACRWHFVACPTSHQSIEAGILRRGPGHPIAKCGLRPNMYMVGSTMPSGKSLGWQRNIWKRAVARRACLCAPPHTHRRHMRVQTALWCTAKRAVPVPASTMSMLCCRKAAATAAQMHQMYCAVSAPQPSHRPARPALHCAALSSGAAAGRGARLRPRPRAPFTRHAHYLTVRSSFQCTWSTGM